MFHVTLCFVNIGDSNNDESDSDEFNSAWFDFSKQKYTSSTEIDEQDIVDAYNHCSDKYKNNSNSDNSKRDYKIFLDVFYNDRPNIDVAEDIGVAPGRITQIGQMVFVALRDCITKVLIG